MAIAPVPTASAADRAVPALTTLGAATAWWYLA
jgi:hypothetical protein